MEVDDILRQARSKENVPHGWLIFPLLRSKVAVGIVGWFFGILIGLGLFALVALNVIPYNYQHGAGGAIFTTLILALFLFIGLGSLWSLILDASRLRAAHTHILVLTPEDFVKQEGKKITHVPLMYVRNVTARGKPGSEGAASLEERYEEIPSAGDQIGGFIFGRGMVPSGFRQRRKRMRTPTSLAFIDSRTDSEVLITNDSSYGDPFMIAALLKQYARSVQHAM